MSDLTNALDSTIRLDFLQNPPLNSALANLMTPNYAFSSIADKEATSRIKSARNAISKLFGKQSALPFSFTSSGFVELFLQFKKIYFLPSLHYEIRHALEIVRPFVALQEIKDLAQNLDSTQKDSTLFIAPLINEDIFSLNQIPQTCNATLALDISYALALGLEVPQNADILLANALPLGLPRDFGLIISDKIYSSTIHKNGVSEAFLGAINERKAKKFSVDLSYTLFEKLKSLFGKDIDLLTRDFAPHTLPLRLRHINTRYLIEHLYLDSVFIQPSQDCALGFVKPSHTLLSLGFSPKQARELCAVSFEKLTNADLVAQKIFESYKMIRLMEF
ncbi:hypothetical protein [Helicobacter sp. 23-1045]